MGTAEVSAFAGANKNANLFYVRVIPSISTSLRKVLFWSYCDRLRKKRVVITTSLLLRVLVDLWSRNQKARDECVKLQKSIWMLYNPISSIIDLVFPVPAT